MFSIDLLSIEKEFDDLKADNDDNSWIEWRYLEIIDNVSKRRVAEWFYVGACSQKYMVKNAIDLTEIEKKSIIIQEVFDEKALFDFAKEKFSRLEFNNWDEFYERMSKEFVHED